MEIEECLEKSSFLESVKGSNKALRSIEISKNKLDRAIRLKDKGFLEDAIVNIYSTMFHAGRALLFKDGFKEKSHYGLYVYIKEKYKDKLEIRFLNELDALRIGRHEILYSLESAKINKEDVEDIISVAKDFISAVEKLMRK